MTEQSKDKITKIIKALLAKAAGTDNENEAAVFVAKAHEMLERYQLDIADMVDAGDPIINHVGLSRAISGHAWKWKLYSAVAQLYGCKSIHVEVGMRQPKPGAKYIPWYEQRLVGRESAIITTDLMYPWIVEQVMTAARLICQQSNMSEQGQAKRVAAALITRIYNLIHEQEATRTPLTPTGKNALLILDQVSSKYEDLYPGAETMRSRPSVTDAAARKAADGISLNKQTGTSKLKRLK